MTHIPYLSVAERLYGLSLIWQEANYNFAFFDRLPDLDWDKAYREYMDRVIAAEDLAAYYDLLARFTALLKDGHTGVLPPLSLYLSRDRPKLMLMNVQHSPVVTNASQTIGSRVPIGSTLLEVDGIDAGEFLATQVAPMLFETTSQRRWDHAVARMLLGPKDSVVTCRFYTPGGDTVRLDLPRNRLTDDSPWLRPTSLPDPWEFMYFEDWTFTMEQGTAPYTEFEFKVLDGNLAYVALNSFMRETVVTAFEEKLPTIRQCAGLILDLRKNHGGNDSYLYPIVKYFLRQPTDVLRPRTLKHIASYRAHGVMWKDIPPDQLPEWAREQVLCYRRQLWHEENWGTMQPSPEVLDLPSAILTSSETQSCPEDFLMAFESGKGQAIRIGAATAGSSGMAVIEPLPGGGQMGVCTVRMPWPEEVWRKGIEPHICVEPTVEDVIRNEDRVLQTAVRYLRGDRAIGV